MLPGESGGARQVAAESVNRDRVRAVEAADEMPDAQQIVQAQKGDFTDRLACIAAEAGARDPAQLGRQLAILLEGATALATSLNDVAPLHEARAVAEILIDGAC